MEIVEWPTDDIEIVEWPTDDTISDSDGEASEEPPPVPGTGQVVAAPPFIEGFSSVWDPIGRRWVFELDDSPPSSPDHGQEERKAAAATLQRCWREHAARRRFLEVRAILQHCSKKILKRLLEYVLTGKKVKHPCRGIGKRRLNKVNRFLKLAQEADELQDASSVLFELAGDCASVEK